jgi:hypothetical protein
MRIESERDPELVGRSWCAGLMHRQSTCHISKYFTFMD